MVCGLFSSFDPTILSSKFLGKWFFALLLFFFSFQMSIMWGSSFYFYEYTYNLFNSMKKSFLLPKGPLLILTGLLFIMLSYNLMAMVPYSFGLSSHLSVNLSFSLSLWMSAMVYSIIYYYKKVLAHLVPSGSPVSLWPLLVLVESVSTVIRPWTLAIRLMANVMAGHLIMNLMGMGLAKILLFFIPSVLVMGGFIFFEICVALVQSYVFVSLLTLYWSE